MTTLKVYNLEKVEQDTVDLNDKIGQADNHPFAVKDVAIQHLARQRQGTHHAKQRADVTGSGKKLYRQKGTGNARAGSVKSPVRRGGGTVFGPVPRSHDFSLNKKVRKLAMKSVIGECVRNDKLIVVDNLKLASHKTRELSQILGKLDLEKALFVYSKKDVNLELASRNLKSVKTVRSGSLNVYDILNYQNVIISKDALLDLEGRLLK